MEPIRLFFPATAAPRPQSLTFEAAGRFDYEGNELEPLDEEAVRTAARALRKRASRPLPSFIFFPS